MRKWQKAAEDGLKALKDARVYLQKAREASNYGGTYERLSPLLHTCEALTNALENCILEYVKEAKE